MLIPSFMGTTGTSVRAAVCMICLLGSQARKNRYFAVRELRSGPVNACVQDTVASNMP